MSALELQIPPPLVAAAVAGCMYAAAVLLPAPVLALPPGVRVGMALALASGAHAQAPQQPLQPQPGAINPASAQPLPPTEAPINTQTPRPNAPGQAVKLELPATFAGVLPCADCAGVAHTLTLQSDGSYRLRRTYLGKAEAPVARSGRWTAQYA